MTWSETFVYFHALQKSNMAPDWLFCVYTAAYIKVFGDISKPRIIQTRDNIFWGLSAKIVALLLTCHGARGMRRHYNELNGRREKCFHWIHYCAHFSPTTKANSNKIEMSYCGAQISNLDIFKDYIGQSKNVSWFPLHIFKKKIL